MDFSLNANFQIKPYSASIKSFTFEKKIGYAFSIFSAVFDSTANDSY